MSLNKVSLWPEQDTAVGFYRILQPGRFLKREGLAKEVRTVPFSGYGQAAYRQYSDKTFMEICNGSDVLHTTLLWRQSDILKALNLRHHFGLRWVVDIDDNIFAGHPDNAAHDNAEVLRKNREMCLQMADGLTVSVPALKELYGRFNANIFVQPNGLDFSMTDPIVPRKTKRLRIGWRGALGHKQDLDLIEPVIASLKKDFDFDFVTFGFDPGFADEYRTWAPFFKEKMVKKTRIETPFFYEQLGDMGVDIAVIPLIDSGFNRCKSNIGWQEWSALKIPVVYSRGENQHDLPGISCETPFEWYEALSSLLRDKSLRIKVGDEQYGYVKEHYDMKKLIYPLAAWMEELPRRLDMEP